MTQLDLFKARAARDEAIARVRGNAGDFVDRALEALRLSPTRRMTGEDIRVLLTGWGIVPHHHNAWGAVVRAGITRGILEETGAYVSMRDIRSHARKTQVYRVR